ncbi:MAG: ABC transporter permease, partial [Stackebrandtia sp.]
MRAAILGVRLQARLMRSDWSALLIVLTVPLSTAVFLAIMLHAGRTDLVSHAVLAPALMALWAMVLLVSAEIVESERTSGTLEQLVASPASVPAFFAGRIALVTGFSFVPLVESWTTAAMCGYPLAVRSPLVFGVVLTLTALAVIGWAGVAAAGFVLVRAVRPLQNTLMFPVYLLSGVL